VEFANDWMYTQSVYFCTGVKYSRIVSPKTRGAYWETSKWTILKQVAKMGGRFGKYGDTKRKARIRRAGSVGKKIGKLKPEVRGLSAKTGCKHRRPKKKQSDNPLNTQN
jgi:hypothetical protein